MNVMPKMATKLDNHDEESFIILGTSPGTSLDVKCNGIPVGDSPMNKADMEDAMRDLPAEANMAFKAYFKFGDGPSPASMMVASSILAEDKSTDELQKKFGEILDENVILKETLKQNNESMKDQFLLIASCQEDMLRTHQMHKEKFDETRGLVEKLRQENKKLKQDMSRLIENTSAPNSQLNGSAPASLTKSQSSDKSSDKSAPTSTIEFVTSPDDDVINKLTAQLELVEKQRRQVIVDNEKLTWQKESLETIVDVTSKERDQLKEKLKSAELQHSKKEEEYVAEINKLNYTIEDLQIKLQMSTSFKGLSSEECKQRDITIQQLEVKVSALQNELKTAQLKILDLESVKLEFSRQKAGTSDIVKVYKDQINDLHNRLKEAQTTVFQPVRISLSSEPETSTSEFTSYMSNVKLYDRTLKHLADLLNSMTHGISESLMDALGLVTSLHEYKLDRTSVDNVKSGLCEVKQLLQRVHSDSLNNKGQIQGTLSIFEGIFQDHKELLKKALCKQEVPSSKPTATTANVEALTNALMARGKELESTKEEMQGLLSTITAMQQDKEDNDLLKAQIEVYKGDFEAERESRQKLASEKDSVATDLRTAQRRYEDLKELLEEVRKINPAIYQSAMSKKKRATPSVPHPTSPRASAASPSTPAGSKGSSTGNMVYTCPKCMRFSSDQYKVMEDHFDFCLDDLM